MAAFRKLLQDAVCQVEGWLALPAEEINWQQVSDDCCSLLAKVEREATVAGVPDAVAACQIGGTSTSIKKTRRILAECLAACPPDGEQVEPVLLTVKQAAARYNMGERTLYRLLEQGELPNRGHGVSKRIKPAELERYLEGPPEPPAAPGSLFD